MFVEWWTNLSKNTCCDSYAPIARSGNVMGIRAGW